MAGVTIGQCRLRLMTGGHVVIAKTVIQPRTFVQLGARPVHAAAIVTFSRGRHAFGAVRFFSAESVAGEKQQRQKATEGAAEGEETQTEDDYYAEEPFAAKVSRIIWGTIKLSFGLGILGFVGYAGYSIVTALLPGGASANAVMRRTSDILRADNDVRLHHHVCCNLA